MNVSYTLLSHRDDFREYAVYWVVFISNNSKLCIVNFDCFYNFYYLLSLPFTMRQYLYQLSSHIYLAVSWKSRESQCIPSKPTSVKASLSRGWGASQDSEGSQRSCQHSTSICHSEPFPTMCIRASGPIIRTRSQCFQVVIHFLIFNPLC